MNLAKLRKENGFRQKELAAACGVTPRHFRAVETGQRESKTLVQKAVAIIRGK